MDKSKKQNLQKVPDLSSIYYQISPSFNREKEYFIENIAILLTSGLDLLSVLEALSTEFKSRGMQKVAAYIKEQVEDGSPFWETLKPLNLVPDYVIALIKIGEESGRLPENFKVIVTQRKKEMGLKSKIQSAMAYPLLVLSLSVVILLGITWFILPSLSGVYSRLGIELPTLTKVLIAIGAFMAQYGIIVAPSVVIGLFLIVYFTFFHPKTKFIGQIILFHTPIISSYVSEIELSRFGFYLGTLMGAGVPIGDTLKSLIDIGGPYPYQKLYRFMYEKILEGYTFERVFSEFKKSEKFIPPVTQNMIKNGENSGHLPEVLQTIGEIYENKTDNATKNLATILEPLLLIVVWAGVAGIALGIVMPIYSLIGNISTFSSGTTNTSNNNNAPVVTVTPSQTEVTPPINPTNEPKITATPTPTATPTAALKTLTVQPSSVGFVNIRDKASTSGKVIGQAKPGEVYSFTTFQSGWYQIVLTNGSTGWISSQYVKENK